jgi:pyruvate/2-oxoglutarate dehydrogenase complex dihydrolipoamide acyltransferase (E2) component
MADVVMSRLSNGQDLRRGGRARRGDRQDRARPGHHDTETPILRGKLMTLTLSGDHRILYGGDAAQFLARLRQPVEPPL